MAYWNATILDVQMYCTCWFNFIWSDNCSTISCQNCLNCYLIFLIVVDYVYMHTRKTCLLQESCQNAVAFTCAMLAVHF